MADDCSSGNVLALSDTYSRSHVLPSASDLRLVSTCVGLALALGLELGFKLYRTKVWVRIRVSVGVRVSVRVKVTVRARVLVGIRVKARGRSHGLPSNSD